MPRKVGGLIRMWREKESDPNAAVTPNKTHVGVRSESSPEEVMGWESDVTTESEKESGCGGAGRKGLGGGMMMIMARMLTDGFGGGGFGRRRLRITGRQGEQTLIQRFVDERMKEVELLKERRAVSEFVHRKKIQNFLIFKSSQKQAASNDHRPQSTAEEINQLNREIAIFYLRRQFSPRAHRSGTQLPTVEKKSVFPTHLSKNHTLLDSNSCEIRGQFSHRTRHICTSSPIVEKKSVGQLNLPKKSLDSENSEIRQQFNPRTHQSCTPSPTVENKSVFPIHLSNNSSDSERCEIREQFSPRAHQIGKPSPTVEKKSWFPMHLPNNSLDTEGCENRRKFSPRARESCTSTPTVEKESVVPLPSLKYYSDSKCSEIRGQFSPRAHQSCIPSPTVEKKSMFQLNLSKKLLDSKSREIGQQFNPRAHRSCTSTPTAETKSRFQLNLSKKSLDPKSCEIRQQFSPRAHQSCTSSPTVVKKSMFQLNLSKKSLDSKSCETGQQQFSPKQQHTCISTPTIENNSVLHTPLSDTYLHSNFHKIRQQFSPRPLRSTENCVEAIERYFDDIIQPAEEEESVNSRSEDLQESSSQQSDLAWEEGERSNDSSSLRSGQDESDIYNNQQIGESDGMWCTGGFSSQRNIEDHRETTLNSEFSETHSVGSEIDKLKTRHMVTTISSDFREELDKVLLTSLKKQRRNEENYILNDECQPVESRDLERSPNDDQTIKMEAIFDMRTEIANIHNEMSDLRKLLSSHMQRSMPGHPVQQQQQDDATAVALHSVSMGGTSASSEWEPINKGSCRICYVNQIDSLLYRCGHMCTCFKCATELLWSSGRCPVCRIPIVDVVRAYSHS